MVCKPKRRCPWARSGSLETDYHDREWGVPVHDDRTLFEFLTLEAAQAGLSWSTILKKREGYRLAYDGFDPQHVARYGARKLDALLGDAGIVRNRLKVEASVANARCFLAVQEDFGSFAAYLWRYTDGTAVINRWRSQHQVPACTELSETLSKDLRKRGFRFVGGTICYAFMQAVGMVNDHLIACFRHRELARY
ncbi:MAG: DNA-3-methyladenine glycosylase [Chromatiales bacterium 21-64-14]|nr:MAG: DNA-3-methyladenine glycosylase [Chromatiales bacterium 21-64-14]HQU16117.1 DNA-3-methyladenine glycosylase I [Gammaproteobacteria bacterium]